MKNQLAALLVAFALSFATTALAAVPGPITLPAKPGAVTFKHDTHSALKCTDCHADAKGGDIAGIGADMDKEAAHKACMGCHKTQGKGPVKCAECHKKG